MVYYAAVRLHIVCAWIIGACLLAWILTICKLGKRKHNLICLRWKISNWHLQTHHLCQTHTHHNIVLMHQHLKCKRIFRLHFKLVTYYQYGFTCTFIVLAFASTHFLHFYNLAKLFLYWKQTLRYAVISCAGIYTTITNLLYPGICARSTCTWAIVLLLAWI